MTGIVRESGRLQHSSLTATAADPAAPKKSARKIYAPI
jgi:hypothetical protein